MTESSRQRAARFFVGGNRGQRRIEHARARHCRRNAAQACVCLWCAGNCALWAECALADAGVVAAAAPRSAAPINRRLAARHRAVAHLQRAPCGYPFGGLGGGARLPRRAPANPDSRRLGRQHLCDGRCRGGRLAAPRRECYGGATHRSRGLQGGRPGQCVAWRHGRLHRHLRRRLPARSRFLAQRHARVSGLGL